MKRDKHDTIVLPGGGTKETFFLFSLLQLIKVLLAFVLASSGDTDQAANEPIPTGNTGCGYETRKKGEETKNDMDLGVRRRGGGREWKWDDVFSPFHLSP